ncbi:hypothetical protein V2J09_008306 [Rumex salicifolius]
MKRTRQEFEFVNVEGSLATVANYLMLLSRTSTTPPPPPSASANYHRVVDRVFECKTCNRQFTSFQALGGHRASHKKPKISGPAQSSSENSSISNENSTYYSSPAPAAKKTLHECSICGAEFAMGQALGGHMRRHRAALIAPGLPSTALTLSLASCRPVMEEKKAAEKAVVMSGGGVGSALCLDLSL